MRTFRIFTATLPYLTLAVLLLGGSACKEYKQKQTVGNPESFNSTSNGSGANLLPNLDANCGGSSCIR